MWEGQGQEQGRAADAGTAAGLHGPFLLLPPCWQVCGYRMRLHFDGYSECHDFWLNADSPDIHPAGWFEETGHKLQPPKGKELICLGWWVLLKEGDEEWARCRA